MKKNYFITMVVCLFTLGTIAQPVITYNGNAPQIGDIYNEAGAIVSIDPGPAGGNQSWDFSDVSPTYTYSINVVSSESTPFADEFPEANMAFQDLLASNSYIYLQLTESEMLNVGVGFDPGADETVFHYTDAVKQMQYPFSFSNTYTDTYFTTYIIMENVVVRQTGSVNVTADAWGSIKTPGGTYSNTLRLKKERVHTDSVFSNGIFINATTTSRTDYEWYTATSHYPVAQVLVDNEGGSSIAYSTTSSGIEDNPLLAQIKIYPNPVEDIINVKLPDGITGKIEINIVNLTGQQLSRLEKTGNNQFSADISALTPGVYIIRMKNGTESYTITKFIKQ